MAIAVHIGDRYRPSMAPAGRISDWCLESAIRISQKHPDRPKTSATVAIYNNYVRIAVTVQISNRQPVGSDTSGGIGYDWQEQGTLRSQIHRASCVNVRNLIVISTQQRPRTPGNAGLNCHMGGGRPGGRPYSILLQRWCSESNEQRESSDT
jgi:hypothetical protein